MADFISSKDYWELTPDPGLVLRAWEVRLSGETEPRLRILNGEDEWELSFSRHSYELTTQDGQRSNVQLKSLAKNHVTMIRALQSGVLNVTFEDGMTLTVVPALEYEAWELRKNDEIVMFASPLGAESGLVIY